MGSREGNGWRHRVQVRVEAGKEVAVDTKLLEQIGLHKLGRSRRGLPFLASKQSSK